MLCHLQKQWACSLQWGAKLSTGGGGSVCVGGSGHTLSHLDKCRSGLSVATTCSAAGRAGKARS